MNRYGKRCVLYPRVSTEMQVDGYSLEGQKNMLTRFADREEMIVVDTYEDLHNLQQKRGAGQGSSKTRYFKKLLLCSSAYRL